MEVRAEFVIYDVLRNTNEFGGAPSARQREAWLVKYSRTSGINKLFRWTFDNRLTDTRFQRVSIHSSGISVACASVSNVPARYITLICDIIHHAGEDIIVLFMEKKFEIRWVIPTTGNYKVYCRGYTLARIGSTQNMCASDTGWRRITEINARVPICLLLISQCRGTLPHGLFASLLHLIIRIGDNTAL